MKVVARAGAERPKPCRLKRFEVVEPAWQDKSGWEREVIEGKSPVHD